MIDNNSVVPQLRLLDARFHSSTTHVGFMLDIAPQTRVYFRIHFEILLLAVILPLLCIYLLLSRG
jgi:hypothetical protein